LGQQRNYGYRSSEMVGKGGEDAKPAGTKGTQEIVEKGENPSKKRLSEGIKAAGGSRELQGKKGGRSRGCTPRRILPRGGEERKQSSPTGKKGWNGGASRRAKITIRERQKGAGDHFEKRGKEKRLSTNTGEYALLIVEDETFLSAPKNRERILKV